MWRPSAHNPSTLKLKQEEYHEFTAILGCTVSSSSAWAAELRLCVIKRKQTKKRKFSIALLKVDNLSFSFSQRRGFACVPKA